MQTPELFIVMIDYRRGAPQGIVDQSDNWSDALDKAREAMGDGNAVASITHVHDGVSESRTMEALEIISKEAMAACAEPERDETEQAIIDWLRDHSRDLRKHEVA